MSAASTPYPEAGLIPTLAPRLDTQERAALIEQHTVMVRQVVGRMAMALPRFLDTDDLIGYGTIGLIEAVDRFDPARGVPFEPFALERIRGSVIDAVRAADPVPRSTRRRAKEIHQASQTLSESLGRLPRDEEVASHLGLSLTQVHRAISDSSQTTDSIHRLVRSGGDETQVELMECLDDPTMLSPEDSCDERELHASVVRALRCLNDRERQVLSLYYERGLTLREVSLVLDLSESRIWQLHARAISRIRAYIHADGETYSGRSSCA